MPNFDKFYFQPQISFVEDHLGFSVMSYWGNNSTARYLTINFLFINLFVSFNFGFKKI